MTHNFFSLYFLHSNNIVSHYYYNTIQYMLSKTVFYFIFTYKLAQYIFLIIFHMINCKQMISLVDPELNFGWGMG